MRTNPFEQYEAEKKRLERAGMSPEEYAKSLREISKRYGV